MKKTILALVAAFAVGTSAMAQSNNTQKKQMKRQDRTERMVKELGLNETQAAQLKTLNEKYQSKMGPQGGGGQPPQDGQKPQGTSQDNNRQQPPQLTDAQKKEMKSNREAYEKELKAILTDSQYQTYQSKRKQGPQQKKTK